MPKATYEPNPQPEGVLFKDMPDGSFGLIVDAPSNAFDKGKIVFKNIGGVHVLGSREYWSLPANSSCRVRLLTSGKIIIDLDAK